MFWYKDCDYDDYYIGSVESSIVGTSHDIPCWSVGALLELIPQSEDFTCDIHFAVWEEGLICCKYELSIEYYRSEEEYNRFIKCDDSIVDLLYDGVVWLLENGYIKKGE